MDADEVAIAFASLHKSGKVREFGVSNFSPAQVGMIQRTLLKKLEQPLVSNQVEISLAKLDAFTDATLDQCQTLNLTPLAWSPLAGGLLGDGGKASPPGEKAGRLAGVIAALDAMAAERNVTRAALALAWLLKHPAKIIPIIGSTNPDRIRAAAAADKIELSREDWYRLLHAARGEPLP